MVRDKASDVERALGEMRNRDYWNRKRRAHRLLGIFLLIGFFVMLTLLFWLPTAHGAEREDRILALLLARTCVAEIGFKGEIEECHLMWVINLRNAELRNRSLGRQTLRFNAYWKSPKRQKKFPWIKNLTDDNKPKLWPKKLKWSQHKDKWLSFYEAAIAFVTNPKGFDLLCIEAIDYGSPFDIPDSSNLETVECLGGHTRQKYWRLKPWKVTYKDKRLD